MDFFFSPLKVIDRTYFEVIQKCDTLQKIILVLKDFLAIYIKSKAISKAIKTYPPAGLYFLMYLKR